MATIGRTADALRSLARVAALAGRPEICEPNAGAVEPSNYWDITCWTVRPWEARLSHASAPSPPRKEAQLDLLGAGLDAACIALENGKVRGQVYLDAIGEAIDLARRQGQMTFAHSILRARGLRMQ